MMSLSRRHLLGTIATVAVTGFAPSVSRAQSPRKISLALDWYPNANHAGLFLAQERGYFTAAGLDVELYTPSDPSVVLQTVGAGRDDFGISYQTDVLLGRGEKVPVVSVAALVQHPLMGIMTLQSSDITHPADLVGKTVGYPGIPSQRAFLQTMLETDGATMDDIELIDVQFNLVPAVISGQVDAAMGAFWSHEPILAEQEGYPVDMMRVEKWGVPDYYELVLVASEEKVANDAGLIENLLGAIGHGYRDALADPDTAIAVMKKAYPELDEKVERIGIGLLADVWLDPDGIWGAQSAQRWTDYANWMKQADLIPADLDEHAAFDATLLPAQSANATPTATT